MAIDRQTAELLEEINRHVAAPGETPTISDARAGATALFSQYAGAYTEDCRSEDRVIAGNASDVPVRIYWPLGEAAAPRPIIVFLHGGGWSMGDVASYDGFVRAICAMSQTIIVSVDYRLAPEHKYPSAIEDARTVTEWVLIHAQEIGGDPSRIAMMGDSSGGNLVAVVAHMIHKAGQMHLAAQFLLYPVLDISRPHNAYPSRMAFGDGEYMLSRDSIDTAADWYLPIDVPRDQPDVSPMNENDLHLLPPTVILIGGYDPLLDEAKAYRDKLIAAGVDVDFKCFESAIHAFLSFGVLDVSQQGRRYLAEKIMTFVSGEVRAVG